MARSKVTSLDSLSFQDINEDAELIPLMTPEDEEAMNKEELPEILPILPLRNTVLFPGVVIPITAGRDKSIKLIKDAKRSYKKVVKLNNAWRDTHKIIKKAEKAHADKKYSKSKSLAKKALNQSKMAIEQHNSQKDNYRFLDD